MDIDEIFLAECNAVSGMIQSPGWKIFIRDLEVLREKEYAKLRKSNRDSAFYKIQGFLNAIDAIKTIVNTYICDRDEMLDEINDQAITRNRAARQRR